jgi:hypothetical protein
MSGTLTESEVLEQLKHASDQYLTGATGTPVQDDQNARVATANASHTAKTNALFSELNSEAVEDQGVSSKVYTGGNVVTPVNPTYMETQVRTALDNDALFSTGGAYTSNYVPLSPYLDPLWLIEAQKLTGENMF